MNRIVSLLLLAPVAACVTMPKTAEEYRQQFRAGTPWGGKKEDRTIERSFQKVLADVRSSADKCFNVVTEHRRPSDVVRGGQVIGHTTYRSSTTGTSSTSAEMTVRMLVGGPTNMPEGGYFAVLGDIEAVAPTKTVVTVYGPGASQWSDALDSVFSWAEGKPRTCPKLP